MRGIWKLALVGVVAVGLSSCSGDITQQILNSQEMQTKVMDMISGNAGMAGTMVDKLIGSEQTRAMLLEKVMGNADAATAVLGQVAKSPEMVENVINMAVQDEAMKAKIMDMVKGWVTAKK
jgi:hypothetical protein